VKDLTGSSMAEAAVNAGAVTPDPREEQRWAREVLRRGVLELLFLGSNLAIAGGALLGLYQLLTHKPALQTGLVFSAAVSSSLFAYHFARWRASATMSRQVEKLTACLIATFGIALVWGGICFAFTFGVLSWFGAPGGANWIVAGILGLCGFAYLVAGEWGELDDCLALPTSANQNRQSDQSTA
jgi:hypothetical protein